MNVSGAGIGGIIGSLKILFLAAPILVLLILIQLEVFKSIGKPFKLLSIIVCYVLILACEILLGRSLNQDFLLFFLWVLGYLLLMSIMISSIKKIKVSSILKLRQGVGVLSFVIIPVIYFCTKEPGPYINNNFEKEIVGVLNLKLVDSDSLYSAENLIIKGDTVAGFYYGKRVEHWVDGGPDYQYSAYFFKSLRDSSCHYEVSTGGYSSYQNAFAFSDNSIYLDGDLGGNLFRRIYPDGTQSNHLVYNGSYFAVFNRINFKNLRILSNHQRFLIYDEAVDKLVLEQRGNCFNKLHKNLLFFVDTLGTTLNCLDIEKMKVLWEKRMKPFISGMPVTLDHPDLISYKDNISITAFDAGYVVSAQTGRTIWKYRWITPDLYNNKNTIAVENESVFVSDGSLLMSFNIKSSKKIWQIKNASFYGLVGSYLIASSSDKKLYVIVDKRSGKIIRRIRRSDRPNELRLLGNYLLLGGENNITSIYKWGLSNEISK